MALIACTSKNDRAELLFGALQSVRADVIDLGRIESSKAIKLMGMLSSLSFHRSNLRHDFHFSPIIAKDLERTSARRLRSVPGVTHILQWGATSFPAPPRSGSVGYSVVTDAPYDPDDDSYPSEWVPGRWKGEFFQRQRAIYSAARFVFVLSEWGRQKLLKVHPLDPNRVIRIGWGPMFERRRSTELGRNRAQVVSIGNGWERKGMDIAAAAATELRWQHPEAKVVIAGKPFGLTIPGNDAISVIPNGVSHAEVIDLIENSRALIVASRFDPSPHIILEALQLGTPVVVTDRCGMPEVVRTPGGGRVVPPDDPHAMAAALGEILEGEELEQRKAAREAYEALGGWRRAAEIVSAALDTV